MIAGYCPSGKQIVSASWDDTVRLWNAETGETLQTLRGHTADVSSVLFSPDGARIFSAGEDQTIRVWDSRTGKQARALTGHAENITCLALSPDGRILASGSKGVIRTWALD